MKVIKLQVQNYLGVKAVEINPDGDVIRIEGRNGQGKSSVINAIWAAIGGASELPDNPVRKGETNAQITVDLGDMIVTRKFTEKGTSLEIKNKDGLKFPRPQETLDKLFSRVTMDPQHFSDMRPKERRELLLELTGKKADIEKLEQDRTEVFNERTMVNREVKTLAGKLDGAPVDDDVEPVSIAALLKEQEKQEEIEDKRRRLVEDANDFTNEALSCEREVERIEEQIAELKARMDELYKDAKKNHASAEQCDASAKELPETDIPDIRQQIEQAEEVNEKARQAQAAKQLREEYESRKKDADALTKKIADIDKKKGDILLKANLPIDNVTVEGDLLYIDGTPFDDLSTSEQIKASMQIGMALNPELRVLRIARGSELDGTSMEEVKRFAKETDCQVWMECVTDTPQEGIFIEDGTVIDAEAVTA